MTSSLLHDLVIKTAGNLPTSCALSDSRQSVSYAQLATEIGRFCSALQALDVGRGERVGIYLDKRIETVTAFFGTSAAGGVFVPVNPILKPDQVSYILMDCNVRVLVTSVERFNALAGVLFHCHDLRHIILIGQLDELPLMEGISVHRWNDLLDAPSKSGHRVIDMDMAAILYTSGSTGKPKGVVLSHRNIVAGAKSVAGYLQNHSGDSLLAALPLSFDAGFSQLTTSFSVGARVVLLNYLMPRDVLKAVVKERITGLTAVPPLWIQLAQLEWPDTITEHLRYFANTGGRMPLETLNRLRQHLPKTLPYLMYGLTEAFRSTYLPPEQIDRRPDSIGKAIPNAEILVLREDGTPCSPNEPGELVHRGALVAMGYWNDRKKTAERFKPLSGREQGLMLTELAVFSGDTVRMDEEGFLYFISRRDEMIKTSGYRVSPTEVEEVLYSTRLVGEAAALGVFHPTLGQAIVVVATPSTGKTLDADSLLTVCREQLPPYMFPAKIEIRSGSLPRNQNGKIDRKLLASEFVNLFGSPPS